MRQAIQKILSHRICPIYLRSPIWSDKHGLSFSIPNEPTHSQQQLTLLPKANHIYHHNHIQSSPHPISPKHILSILNNLTMQSLPQMTSNPHPNPKLNKQSIQILLLNPQHRQSNPQFLNRSLHILIIKSTNCPAGMFLCLGHGLVVDDHGRGHNDLWSHVLRGKVGLRLESRGLRGEGLSLRWLGLRRLRGD